MTDRPLGVLELKNGRDGFLRRKEHAYLAESGDVFVAQRLIQRLGLRTGDMISGTLDQQRGRGRGPALASVSLVNGLPADSVASRPEFSRLTAIHPNERLRLECEATRGTPFGAIGRVIDILCPFGKGQRALIVAPAKAGKTTVLQAVAAGIAANYPQAEILILLADERPEEVTEMESCGVGEVVASSFDFPADRHVGVAEITLERARRRVESGHDVVLILDSITRLARAYNTIERGDGRTLSGGLGAQSLERPKRFFGSARAVDPAKGGGSLTIIGTALVDTGSKMDQVIFEEFKGTGNSELVLSRELADRRVYPAIDLTASATRKEELLLTEEELIASHGLRKQIAALPTMQGMQLLLELFKRTATNEDLVKESVRVGKSR
ncbi:MAG: transcription termination factor Rho [Gemmatimonadetes bacterium]|nr:transcription termination factor Rho [Gemmatimonadota bacterium]